MRTLRLNHLNIAQQMRQLPRGCHQCKLQLMKSFLTRREQAVRYAGPYSKNKSNSFSSTAKTMRHGIAFRKLNRTTAHRESMFKTMVTQLIEHDAINTTLPKATTVTSQLGFTFWNNLIPRPHIG